MGGNYDDDFTKIVCKFTAWFDSMFTPVFDFTFCIDFSYALGVRKLVNIPQGSVQYIGSQTALIKCAHSVIIFSQSALERTYFKKVI